MTDNRTEPLLEDEPTTSATADGFGAHASSNGNGTTGSETSSRTAVLERWTDPDTDFLSDSNGNGHDGDGTSPSGGGGGRGDLPETQRRRFPRPKTILIALLILLPLLAVAGVAWATSDYSDKYDNKILPGASIAGTDVGGMTRGEAIAAVRKSLRPQMRREVTVRWRSEKWTVTPAQLGAKSDARSAVDAALAESDDVGMVDKARMRFLGQEMDFTEDVALRYPKKPAVAFIEDIKKEFDKEPRDADLDYSSGWVEIVKERNGRKINIDKSTDALLRALRGGAAFAGLDVRTPKPEVTAAAFDQVLLLRQSEYKLYFYQDGKITHEWTVAVGQPAYPTPTGEWEVTELRYMPTWVNPDPEGWGADMPASIPPGPGNPLGLRAINWDASGIRFHGTSDIGSLGTAASHGCVRMSNDDVIELYDMVEVGTPIISIY